LPLKVKMTKLQVKIYKYLYNFDHYLETSNIIIKIKKYGRRRMYNTVKTTFVCNFGDT